MKSILISIKPEWVEKILDGSKTVEIRKSIPKCELPCKVYIYETKDKILIGEHFERSKSKENLYFGGKAKYITKKDYYFGKGKIVAEFTLNRVEELENVVLPTIHSCVYLTKTKRFASAVEKESCLSQDEIYNYLGGKNGYAWYIDNLKIYDTPKELSKFDRPEIDLASEDCRYGIACPMYKHKKIIRPPQSWCYVEEIGE